MKSEIRITRSKELKPHPKDKELGFGQFFTDHMFVMDYSPQSGWSDPRIEPYGAFPIEPAAMVFHYGQAIFDGMKAYRSAKGTIHLFRPHKYLSRLNESARRVCIPEVDTEFVLDALKVLIGIERGWIPNSREASLYIRPFIIATDSALGVRASRTYRFFIILSPVGAYYPEGFKPVKIFITTKYVRAVRGGVGEAKTSGNYAASLLASEEAKKLGFTQVLWLDAIERRFIEEVGTMNIFVKLGDELATPALSGSVLSGITRDSVIRFCRDRGIRVSERPISIDEVIEAHKSQTLKEVFGSGTAAVISPVSELWYSDQRFIINDGEVGETAAMLYDEITAIQYGLNPDPYGWIMELQ